jgi:osmotically inducible protein OsmC
MAIVSRAEVVWEGELLSGKGTVPGLDQAAFEAAANAAKDGCPISNALKGNLELSVKATLNR